MFNTRSNTAYVPAVTAALSNSVKNHLLTDIVKNRNDSGPDRYFQRNTPSAPQENIR
jgi:hypothetical protein